MSDAKKITIDDQGRVNFPCERGTETASFVPCGKSFAHKLAYVWIPEENTGRCGATIEMPILLAALRKAGFRITKPTKRKAKK